MRIQHNISAMNSYRNFSANNSKLSKNLEKLSTGYKINRAADDAAGLAISEKMRVQISGIEGATKNAKDGISLVQTAEGALTEVHDMLNRMVTLAEQSANGTYDDEVDRAQLQKEVDALKSEIDRVADSTNYNGIKLLDGSLSESAAAKSGNGSSVAVSGIKFEKTTVLKGAAATYTAEALTSLSADGSLAAGAKATFEMKYTDRLGNEKTYSIEITGDGTGKGTYTTSTGKTGTLTSDVKGKAQNMGKALAKVMTEDTEFATQFAVATTADGVLQFTSKEAGANAAHIEGGPGAKGVISFSAATVGGTALVTKADLTQTDSSKMTDGVDRAQAYQLTASNVWDISQNDDVTASKLASKSFTVDGKSFVFVKGDPSTNAKAADLLKSAGIDGYVISATGTPTAAEVTTMIGKIEDVTGLDLVQGTATGYAVKATAAGVAWTAHSNSTPGLSFYIKGAKAGVSSGGGLTLQIGDTSDAFNKMTVSIEDMHSKTIGIGDVDISSQRGASEAIDKIKGAVNFVSNTRGTLGALQNRLDHTINNLGVMRENIQNAESLIRDTDVAEEMMTYTKNNILNQSAQAMLAQANQLPQGVLQLLG